MNKSQINYIHVKELLVYITIFLAALWMSDKKKIKYSNMLLYEQIYDFLSGCLIRLTHKNGHNHYDKMN